MELLAQIESSPAQAPGGFLQVVLLLAFFLMMYMLLIRPAHKRQKALQQMQSSLQTGARVVTSGGLKGTVVRVEGDTVKLRVADNVKVDVTRSSIVAVEGDGASSRKDS
ncbi:MAG: preprotein translocase subunit YajC [Acidobacteriota bacterium]